ncbi:MAG: alpha/beta hydrolase [Atopobiaceae bacterium]|nr:alpha/beta hydrolase [Atopobiaceae bacterium]
MTNVLFIETERLKVAFRHVGGVNARKLLFLHGNLSSSVCLDPLFPYLSEHYDVVAPDLRCFGETEPLPIDATRGYRDWSDDIAAFVKELGWDSFILAGWSMGGDIAMQFTIDHPEMVEELILLCPGPPYGFGGSYGIEGEAYDPEGLGSGAGTAFPGLVYAIEHKSLSFLRDMMLKQNFTPGAKRDLEWENRLVHAMTHVTTGTEHFPGNYSVSTKWPYVVAGDKGVLNAMTPTYGRLDDFIKIADKPPVLWIRGEKDQVVSDHSSIEFGALGEDGTVPGWPGADTYPAQPMIRQLREFFAKYQDEGGSVTERIMPGGHMCAQQHPELFTQEVNDFIRNQSTIGA